MSCLESRQIPAGACAHVRGFLDACMRALSEDGELCTIKGKERSECAVLVTSAKPWQRGENEMLRQSVTRQLTKYAKGAGPRQGREEQTQEGQAGRARRDEHS